MGTFHSVQIVLAQTQANCHTNLQNTPKELKISGKWGEQSANQPQEHLCPSFYNCSAQ
jgi:hypothetical protein